MKEFHNRLAELAQAIGAARQAAEDVGSTQVPTLTQAVNSTTAAVETVRAFEGLIRGFHSQNREKSNRAQTLLKQACREVLGYSESTADYLRAAAKTIAEERIGLTFQPRPQGRILFDGNTGVFEYNRDTQDIAPFTARFSGGIRGQPVSQSVTIAPVPRHPATAKDIIDGRMVRGLFESQLESRYNPDPEKKKLILSGLDLTLDPERGQGRPSGTARGSRQRRKHPH